MPQTRSFTSTNGVEELTASMPLDMTKAYDAKYLRTVVSAGRTQAQRPWKWMTEIGEVNYGISRGAKIAGYAKITARKLEKDGTPGEIVTTGKAAEVAASLSSPYGGVRGLIDRFFTLMKVPGDGYLIRTRADRDGTGDPTGYDFIGANEIATESTDGSGLWMPGNDRNSRIAANQNIRRITFPQGGGSTSGESLYHDVKAADFLGRIWRPAAQFVDQAASPMRALDTECELLHLLTINLKAKLTSRMALNGIFFVPSEINDIRTGAPKGNESEFHDNKVLDALIKAATWAIINHERPDAAVPIFMTGPGQFGDMIKHIVMDREIYATDMLLRAELIDRILTGLDVQKAKAKGDEQSNHWNAWANNDDELRVNVKPDLEMFCWALTRMVLYREMLDAQIKPETVTKYVLWYDLSAATTSVNQAEDARQAADRILIGPAASRRMMNIKEADAPTEAEQIRAVGLKLNVPMLAVYGLEEAKNIDWDKVAASKTGPPADSPADPSQVGPGKGNPGSPNDGKNDTPRKLRPA